VFLSFSLLCLSLLPAHLLCVLEYRFLQDSNQFLGKKEMTSLNPSFPNPFSGLFSGVLMMPLFIFYRKDTTQNHLSQILLFFFFLSLFLSNYRKTQD